MAHDRDKDEDTIVSAVTLVSAPIAPDGDIDDEPTRAMTKEDTSRAMARAFLDSDYPEALAFAEQVLFLAPQDSMARRVAHECRVIMEIGAAVPVRQSLSAEPFDDGTASVLMLVDGRMTVHEIVFTSGLEPLETVRVIEELVEKGVLRLQHELAP
jgi:hypothetical protein